MAIAAGRRPRSGWRARRALFGRGRSNTCRGALGLAVVLVVAAASFGVRASAADSPDFIASPTAHVSQTHRQPGFVRARGKRLELNGKPFRFTGLNIYMAASGGTPSSCGGELYPNVGVPLSKLPDGVVIRFWAFQQFYVSHGQFHWKHFDQVLKIAAIHHDKVIPVLGNEYDYCDAIPKTASWFRLGYRTQVPEGDLTTYRRYVAQVVSRYARNRTIAMWQLVNEAEAVNHDGSCTEATAYRDMRRFSNQVGGMVHRLDPNHLVSLGALAGYSGSGNQWCGSANRDYQRLMATKGSDVCDFHDYGWPSRPGGPAPAPNLRSAVRMCHADGKPLMVAETGIHADSKSALRRRAHDFRMKFSTQFRTGVVGELLWDWAVKPDYRNPDPDAWYGISPGDPALSVLRPYRGS